jgi:hypothetical protein
MIATRYKHPIAVSGNDKQVYASLTVQPLAGVISRNPHLVTLVKEVVQQQRLTAEDVRLEHDFGHPIGYCELADVKPADTIFYAKQLKADSFTKFVKNRRAQKTSVLTLKLKRDETGNYELLNVWLGSDFPAMPGESDETAASKQFWDDHAVIFNGQAIIASTLTKDCPY